MEIIVKRWEHYNRALGKYISTKRQYFDELKKGGFIPFEKAEALPGRKEKQWIPSKDCIDVCQTLYNTSDRNKKICLKDYPKIVEKMREKGMKFELPNWLPKHYQGGGYAVEERGK